MASSVDLAPEILQDILTTLHRLETRFEEQSHNLSDLDCFSHGNKRSPFTPVSDTFLPEHSNPQQESSRFVPEPLHITSKNGGHVGSSCATDYMRSVLDIRHRFEFDSRSDVNEFLEEHVTRLDDTAHQDMRDDSSYKDSRVDWYTMSAYSSRPLSRLELDVPPVPDISPQYNCNCGSPQLSNTSASETEVYHHPASTDRSPNSTSYRPSMSDSIQSVSTIPSSAPSINTDKGTQEEYGTGATPSLYMNLKQSVKRSISMRSQRAASTYSQQKFAILEEQRVPRKQKISQAGRSIVSTVRNGAKACAHAPPRLISFVTRRLVEQQLKMLEIKN